MLQAATSPSARDAILHFRDVTRMSYILLSFPIRKKIWQILQDWILNSWKIILEVFERNGRKFYTMKYI